MVLIEAPLELKKEPTMIEGRIAFVLSKVETGNITEFSTLEMRHALDFLHKKMGILSGAQALTCIELSIKIIEARPVDMIIQYALDLLDKSIERQLPSYAQLERFLAVSLIGEHGDDYVYQFSRSRAILICQKLIERAPNQEYAEASAIALARESSFVSVKVDMLPLSSLMNKLADGWRHGASSKLPAMLKNSAAVLAHNGRAH